MGKTKKLDATFFERPAPEVARDLLGKLLVRKIGRRFLIGKIVETEAYLGAGDAASHAHRGMTERNKPMFGPAGHTYVYFTYGMHWLLNFVTEKEGKPSGVLIRALEPLVPVSDKRIASGPAKLTKWLGVDKSLNDIEISRSDELFVCEEIEVAGEKFVAEKIARRNMVEWERVGVDYAGGHKSLPLRFYIKNNPSVSRK